MSQINPALGSESKGLIWCYTDQLSYAPGEMVSFHVSSQSPSYSMTIARIGLKGEVVWEGSQLAAEWQDIPEKANEYGCEWPVSLTLQVPLEWRSGYYQVLVRAEGLSGRYAESEHFFVVRSAHPGRDAKILFVLSTNTYLAYNSWGGGNLYSSKDVFEFHQEVSTGASLLRPFEPGLLSKLSGAPRMMFPVGKELAPMEEQGRPYRPFSIEAEVDYWTGPSGFIGRWEEIFVKWLEEKGYSVDYAIQYDLDSKPGLLDSYQMYLSVGHDEYWSWKERDVVENWIEEGGNLAMFSGNSVFWQVRFEDEGKRMVCYKHKATELDPVMGTPEEKYVTSIWSSKVIQRPENHLTGISFTRGGYARTGMSVPRGSAGYTVYRPDHWAFEGTGLEYGDLLGNLEGIIGYENDGCDFQVKDGLPYPTGKDGSPVGMEILAMTPVSPGERTDRGYVDLKVGDSELHTFARELLGADTPENREKFRYGHAMMVQFSKGKGNVFNGGATEWAYGIEGKNPFVERITDNVMKRFAKEG
ncbi:N,N-dimethylformamidase beta subunit family domain-containing protein [Ammoniphilus sp. CFH 90114]|uniref:N,N-dimethylformamidase beta subunit family domain-containing protein n=1 Tax=Ammoniphilus sp. CFH 90114 TaxID=2493665 RepID=UPI00100F60DA|nr:N,N-dimethylformamidase beta subunit family domain-containing protein [Ammoniphilus sp. CFH 90114]RXT02383.1 DUF4350 domain-containing protein [Ammoniphilus sp. CFH 90114]